MVVFVGKLLGFDGLVGMIIMGCNLDMWMFFDVVFGCDVYLGDYMLKGRFYGV